MSVVTNLVVALMIVTSGEEPVRAMPIECQWGDILLCCSTNEFSYPYPTVGGIETLYRKTCKTNFVYGTTIDAHRISEFCAEWPCNATHTFKPHDLAGAKVEQIFFNIGDKHWRCPKHSKAKGGGK